MAVTSKVAVVTGAGTGIGKAVALALMKEGFAVTLAGRRKDKLDETAAESIKVNGQSLVVPPDVSDPASVKALFARTREVFGRCDVLFNNAGIGGATPLEMTPEDEHRTIFETNYFGAVRCIQAVLPAMRE